MDGVDLELLKEAVVMAIQECNEGGLLDLIYKILLSNDIR